MSNKEEKLLTEQMLMPQGTTLNVLADGIKAKCVLGSFGTWSDRIRITFETDHPKFKEEFSTKDFDFKEPGIIEWGRENNTMKITVADDDTSFDEAAASAMSFFDK